MLIFKLVGQELSDLNVADIKPWVMHAEVAEKFLCYENRVILAGDAAHRFPPAGGFGKCSTIYCFFDSFAVYDVNGYSFGRNLFISIVVVL